MLLGNKADLNDKNEELRTEAEQLAKEHNMIFMEVSAKTGENVDKAMNKLLDEIVRKEVEIIPMKDIFMTFLLHLNDNFDDDLLQDAIFCLDG